MTNKNTPDQIFAGPDEEDGWRWPNASKFPDPPRRIIRYVRADLVAKAVAAEREACAQYCEEYEMGLSVKDGGKYLSRKREPDEGGTHTGMGYAAAIRARGEANE